MFAKLNFVQNSVNILKRETYIPCYDYRVHQQYYSTLLEGEII